MNSVSPSSSADPRRDIQMRSHFDVSGSGRWQRPPYHLSYSELQIPSISSDICSPISVDSSASSFSQYPLIQFSASPTYSTEHCSSQEAGTTVAHYQQSMAMFNASLNRSTPNSQGTAQPLTGVPTAPSPVPYNVQLEIPEPAIAKKRKRKDARQLQELHRVFALTTLPSTETRRQLARNLDLSPRCVQIWWAHIFSLYTACIISESSNIFSLGQVPERKTEASRRTKSFEPFNQPGHRHDNAPSRDRF